MWYDCGTCKKGNKKAPNFQRIIEENQKLSLVTRTGIEPVVVTPGYYMLVSANVNYAVNRSTNGGRAIIWPIATGYNDSRLYDNDESVIRLYTSRELLTAREPVGDWSTVYFGGSGISVWVRAH